MKLRIMLLFCSCAELCVLIFIFLQVSIYILRDSNVSVVRERETFFICQKACTALAGMKVTSCTNLFSHLYFCQSLVLLPLTFEQFEFQTKLDQNQSLA